MSHGDLKPCPFCGGEASKRLFYKGKYRVHCNVCDAHSGDVCDTEAEAIAAWNSRVELGSEPPYDELLRCLENDWNISASWDGLRRFWHIGLTEEGVRLRDAELNSRAERTCKIVSSYLNDFTSKHICWYEFEMQCGFMFTWDEMEPPNYCPNCGCKVVGE